MNHDQNDKQTIVWLHVKRTMTRERKRVVQAQESKLEQSVCLYVISFTSSIFSGL